MSQFTNNDSNIGAQGDNMNNQGDVVANGEIKLKDNSNVELELNKLREAIEGNYNTEHNLNMLDNLEESKQEDNKDKFIKYINILKNTIGLIPPIINLFSLIN